MYTFEDWLNDNFGDREGVSLQLVGDFHLGRGMLEEFSSKHKMISMEDVKKIRKCQEEAFDSNILLLTQFWIKGFEDAFQKTEFKNREELIELEAAKWEEEIYPAKFNNIRTQEHKNKEINLLRCKKGEKDFHSISGGQYQEVLIQYQNYQEGKSFVPVSIPGHLHRVKAILEYLEYLKNLINPNQLQYGLQSSLTIEELKLIYEKATNNGYVECTEGSFLASFSSKELPHDFQPIRWMVVSSKGTKIGEAHLWALRDFISVCVSGKVHKKGLSKDVRKFFVDRKYKGITLLKPPPKGLSSAYALDFENMLK